MTGRLPDSHGELLETLLQLPPGLERDRLLETLRGETLASDAGDMYRKAQRIIAVADILWADAHRAPALEEDPSAAMLGLVPDAAYQLDCRAFKRARIAAGLEPTTFARALNQRGWKIDTRDVFNWEIHGAPTAPPALLRAAADILNVDPDRLTMQTNKIASSDASDATDSTEKAMASPRFEKLVARFAHLQGIPTKMARSALRSRMIAAVHRGERPDSNRMLDSLDALIQVLEGPEDGQRRQ